jgi:hypothetical protein
MMSVARTPEHYDERSLPVELDHIIVYATEPRRSATLLADLLNVPVLPDWGPFVRVQSANGVTLDFMRDDPPFTSQHCAFLVDDDTFDTAHRRHVDAHIPIYADPWRRQPGELFDDRQPHGTKAEKR